MAYPDFTELTFGFAFLRELEKFFVPMGNFPSAPDFISQNVEAEKGYDVEVSLDGTTPLFIQLKRSQVFTTKQAKEIKDGSFSDPRIYRMLLHKNGKYRQHKALQNLEKIGNAVFYVTSQIYKDHEFSDAYANNTIISRASAVFSPLEITLPDDTQQHHVSFKENSGFGYVYSAEPNQFQRKYGISESWMKLLNERARTKDENKELLQLTNSFLLTKVPRRSPLHQLIAERPLEQQASILAYFLLGSHLTFVKPDQAT